ncbi:MAG: type II toxin-antitoxin system prevent-host-death family antitoxin [Prevotella sp.]|jgi:antitoxin YefM|nr:type II toxin-antitoxin system prevent-host-death family antitoxin [Prevotella sp.]
MQTVSYTELRSNLKHYLDKVLNNSEPLIVHRSGNESVVVISLEEYNAIKETEYIMSSLAMTGRIKEAEEKLRSGQGKVLKTEDLWK